MALVERYPMTSRVPLKVAQGALTPEDFSDITRDNNVFLVGLTEQEGGKATAHFAKGSDPLQSLRLLEEVMLRRGPESIVGLAYASSPRHERTTIDQLTFPSGPVRVGEQLQRVPLIFSAIDPVLWETRVLLSVQVGGFSMPLLQYFPHTKQYHFL